MKTSWMGAAGLAGALFLFFAGCDKKDSPQTSSAQPPPAAAGHGGKAGPVSILRGPDGALALVHANGAPFDGVKLSKYDMLIFSPCIAVGPDGVIHVAYVEQLPSSPYPQFVYHRQSSDGGKHWSEANNLSQDMPNIGVGTCKLIIDGQNRTYVIWRSAMGPNIVPAQREAAASDNNLVYRCLEKGQWSKILNAHKPTSMQTQDDGSMSFVATVDAAGKAQVIFNTSPNRFHPKEALRPDGLSLGGIGWGLIFQTTLDGANPVQPREWYMAPIKIDPANPVYGRSCDGFNALDGYVDAAGQPHLIAQVVNLSDPNTNMQMIEDGRQTSLITLPPDARGDFASHPPRLLIDAKGARHIIAKYDGGEHPAIFDYLVGSNDPPKVIMSAKAAPASIWNFTAFGGPGGKMAAIIQTAEHGFLDEGDSWLCTSEGGKWSEPICLTNNAGRKSWVSTQTGATGNVSTGDRYGPGPGAMAWENGHLLIVLINNKTGSFGLAAGGVTYASGSSVTPMLFFYRI